MNFVDKLKKSRYKISITPINSGGHYNYTIKDKKQKKTIVKGTYKVPNILFTNSEILEDICKINSCLIDLDNNNE